jgi:hypothetical protein
MVNAAPSRRLLSFATATARDLNKSERNALFYLARGWKLDPIVWPACRRLVALRFAVPAHAGGRDLVRVTRSGRKLVKQLRLQQPGIDE